MRLDIQGLYIQPSWSEVFEIRAGVGERQSEAVNR